MLDVREMKRDETPTSLYNPTTQDFSAQMSDDKNVVHTYIVPAGEIMTYPAYIAHHIGKKLATHIAGQRVTKTTLTQDALDILHNEVEVHI